MMSVYTVHEPPLRATETLPDAERFAFVRDGFYVWAFLLTPLWMLRCRLWLVFLIYAVIAAAIESLLYYAGVGAAGVAVAMLLLSLLVGVEASTLRRFTLARRGWRNVGVVSGNDMEVAERRFFAIWARAAAAKRAETQAAPAAVPPAPMPPVATSSHVIGLFPEPGTQR
jgi:Protein of unknown function (DUF2628)